jgi:hypothetical protein
MSEFANLFVGQDVCSWNVRYSSHTDANYARRRNLNSKIFATHVEKSLSILSREYLVHILDAWQKCYHICLWSCFYLGFRDTAWNLWSHIFNLWSPHVNLVSYPEISSLRSPDFPLPLIRNVLLLLPPFWQIRPFVLFGLRLNVKLRILRYLVQMAGICLSQGLYLYGITQRKKMLTFIHSSSEIPTRAVQDRIHRKINFNSLIKVS